MSSAPLSQSELTLLEDRHFLLTKKKIDSKVSSLLLQSQKKLLSYIRDQDIQLRAAVSLNFRKIARGENHKDMPYWVSDFPAQLTKNNIWTFRALVWWGHEISFSLLLTGTHKKAAEINFPLAAQEPLYYTVHHDPWQPDSETKHQLLINADSEKDIGQHLADHDFIKLSDKYPLNQINHLPEISVTSFEKIMRAIGYLA